MLEHTDWFRKHSKQYSPHELHMIAKRWKTLGKLAWNGRLKSPRKNQKIGSKYISERWD